MNISNNVASMQASQTLLNTTANNIANVNTDGFVPQDTIATNQASETPVAETRSTDNENAEKSQTDLTKEIPNLMIAQRSTEANVAAVKTQDEMLGTVLDLKV